MLYQSIWDKHNAFVQVQSFDSYSGSDKPLYYVSTHDGSWQCVAVKSGFYKVIDYSIMVSLLGKPPGINI